MLKTPVLLTLTFIGALLTWLAQQDLGLPRQVAWATKPLTTILIMAFAWQRGRIAGPQGRLAATTPQGGAQPAWGGPALADTPMLRRWVMAGLFFSLIGDIALMFPKGFVPGLLAFLVAHLAYLWAFTRVRRLASWPWSFVAYGLVAAGILSQLWEHIPMALHVPVTAYVICLGAMAAQAALIGWRAHRETPGTPEAGRAAVLALGGLLFFISDGALAINKFAGPVPIASLLVLPTYWGAQWCIASWLAPKR